jgi:hypothetical protein
MVATFGFSEPYRYLPVIRMCIAKAMFAWH